MKFDSKNPYRNLIKNLRRIIKNNNNIEQKEKDLNNLCSYAQTHCSCTFLLSDPALKFFDIDVGSVPDKRDHSDFVLNPWEQVRTEFLNSMTRDRRERASPTVSPVAVIVQFREPPPCRSFQVGTSAGF